MSTIVQTVKGGTFNSSFTLGVSAVASGNTLIVSLNIATSTGAPSSFRDNGATGTVGWVLDQTYTAGNSQTVYTYRKSNITEAPTNVTFSLGASDFVEYMIEEVNGLTNTSPLDTPVTSAPGDYDASHDYTFSTLQAGDYVRAVIEYDGGVTSTTATSGWGAGMNSGSSNIQIFTNPDLGVSGSKTLTDSLSGSAYGVASFLRYKAAGGGAPTSYYLSDTVEM